jgi:hypothetical protein
VVRRGHALAEGALVTQQLGNPGDARLLGGADAAPWSTRIPARAQSAAAAFSSVVLPIPGSPSTSTAAPRPKATRRASVFNRSISACRPTNRGGAALAAIRGA